MIRVKMTDPYDQQNGSNLQSKSFSLSTKVLDAAKSILNRDASSLAFVCNGIPILGTSTLQEVQNKQRNQVSYLNIRCIVRHIGGSQFIQ